MVPGAEPESRYAKKLLIRLRDAIALNAPPPEEYIEATIAERFGWPPSVMEFEDEGVVLRYVKLLNVAASYRRVLSSTRAHRPDAASEQDWAVFQMLDGLTDD